MRQTRDAVLSNIAKRLCTCEEWPQLPTFDHDAMMAVTRYTNMSVSLTRRHVNVRFYINGHNRVLGTSLSERHSEAARFADLCVLRFSKYRQRKPIPADSDTHFGIKTAEEDYAFLSEVRPDIIQILDDIEEHFLAIGVFRDASDPTQKETPRKETRRTVSAVVTERFTAFYDELLEYQVRITRDIAAQASADDARSKRLEQIEKQLAALSAKLDATYNLLTLKS